MTAKPAGLILSAAMLAILTSCSQIPVQTQPLIGEGPPPGYIGGDIPGSYQGLRNPFTPEDDRAVAAGSILYHAFEGGCVACHGETGQGDGPRWPYIEPAPANFATPNMLAAFREHQDYIFWWVSEGVPKTPMPDWENRMSETERWQVITYAWHLGEKASNTANLPRDRSLPPDQR